MKYSTDQVILTIALCCIVLWMIAYTFLGFPFILPLMIPITLIIVAIVRLGDD